MTPEVSVVIVTWNASATIARCIDSIQQHAPRAEVIVIDNSSEDGTPEFVERRYAFTKVIRNMRNEGFGRACNSGAKAARGEYLFFLNPDAKLEPNCLDRLLDVMRSAADSAVAGPVLRASNGRITGAGARYLTYRTFFLWRVLGVRQIHVPAVPEAVQWVSGAALLVRRQCFDELAGFDERFWMYVEDMHLCWKANRLGRRVVVVPDAIVSHDHATSARHNLEPTLRSNAASTFLWFAETGKRKYSPIARLLIFGSLMAVGTKHCAVKQSLRSMTTYLKLGWIALTAPAALSM